MIYLTALATLAKLAIALHALPITSVPITASTVKLTQRAATLNELLLAPATVVTAATKSIAPMMMNEQLLPTTANSMLLALKQTIPSLAPVMAAIPEINLSCGKGTMRHTPASMNSASSHYLTPCDN